IPLLKPCQRIMSHRQQSEIELHQEVFMSLCSPTYDENGAIRSTCRPLVDSSFPRRREGGFTFQVQQFMAEKLCRSFVVKTLSRSMIIGAHQTEQTVIG